jgi:hypothetical protein
VGGGRQERVIREGETGGQWLTPAIPATWEAEDERIVVQGQPRQIVLENPSPK